MRKVTDYVVSELLISVFIDCNLLQQYDHILSDIQEDQMYHRLDKKFCLNVDIVITDDRGHLIYIFFKKYTK